MSEKQIHPTALVESTCIGQGTKIWAYAHILPNATIGRNCNIGDHVFVESGASVGNNVTIKNHVCLWEGIAIEDDAFIGPHVVFTNDNCPRSPRMSGMSERYAQPETWLERTLVERGCSIGANAIILPGLCLGAFSMIAAGATVTRDVKPYTLVMGAPARPVGMVCRCGARVDHTEPAKQCGKCGYDPSSAVA